MTETANLKIADYLASVAAKRSTPGGGAVAAVVGAEACALISMVANYSKDTQAIVDQCKNSILKLTELADQDALVFEQVMEGYRGNSDLQQALVNAAKVPLAVIEVCIPHICDLETLVEEGNKNLISDLGIAASLFQSTLAACELNVLINVKDMDVEKRSAMLDEISKITAENSRLVKICDQVLNRLK